MEQAEVKLLKLRSIVLFQEGKYNECFQISKLLIDSEVADVSVHEVFAKSIIQCGLAEEYLKYFDNLAEVSKGIPNLQVPVFDYLALGKRYHEMIIYIWECLTKAPNVEVMSYFSTSLSILSDRSSDFNAALNDLANQQAVDPLTRIILSFSSLEVDESLPSGLGKHRKALANADFISCNGNVQSGSLGPNRTTTHVPDQMGPEEAFLRALKPLEELSQSWQDKRPPHHLMSQSDLAWHFAAATGTRHDLIISISHDDYTTIPGGVQVCIQREQAIANQRKLRYLHIYPYYPLMRLADMAEDPDPIVAVNIDGVAIGACRMSVLISWAKETIAETGSASVIVHHLLGHAPELVVELVRATGSNRCVFWLHDFFSMCPSFSLQRNNLVFCGAPSVSSNSCMLCVYGREREIHALRMRKFFETLEISVASPSVVTADFWLERAGLPHVSLSILPHMLVEMVPRVKPLELESGCVTIGFLGIPVRHKGWLVFTRLMQEFGQDNRYRFVVLSIKRPNAGEDSWHPVQVTAQTPNAMSDAVSIERIDIVLHWPSSPETFSFTTFEAIVGGAHIVTHAGSGNVARVVRETGCGEILENEDQLLAFFRDGSAVVLAERRRAMYRIVEVIHRHSEMSFPLIGKG